MASHEISSNIYKAIFQPFSAFSLLVHSAGKKTVHKFLDESRKQNDHRACTNLAEKHDAELLDIDASALKQIENFEWRYGKIPDLKAVGDWINIIAIVKLLSAVKPGLTILLWLGCFNFIIQFLATILKMKILRDQFMSQKLLERADSNEIVALTGALHTPSIAGYLVSEGIEDLRVIGAPEIRNLV
jgi:hypothetical protein